LLRRYAPRNDIDRSEYDFAFPRRIAPKVLLETLPPKSEGAGKTGCALHLACDAY